MLCEDRLLAVYLGNAMFSVGCMFRAGLYVGLGAFGMPATTFVSRGSLLGRPGPTEPVDVVGISRGPFGLDPLGRGPGPDDILERLSNESRSSVSLAFDMVVGELTIE